MSIPEKEKKHDNPNFLKHSKTGNTEGSNDVKQISDLIKQIKDKNKK